MRLDAKLVPRSDGCGHDGEIPTMYEVFPPSGVAMGADLPLNSNRPNCNNFATLTANTSVVADTVTRLNTNIYHQQSAVFYFALVVSKFSDC